MNMRRGSKEGRNVKTGEEGGKKQGWTRQGEVLLALGRLSCMLLEVYRSIVRLHLETSLLC